LASWKGGKVLDAFFPLTWAEATQPLAPVGGRGTEFGW